MESQPLYSLAALHPVELRDLPRRGRVEPAGEGLQVVSGDEDLLEPEAVIHVAPYDLGRLGDHAHKITVRLAAPGPVLHKHGYHNRLLLNRYTIQKLSTMQEGREKLATSTISHRSRGIIITFSRHFWIQ